jgi:hypothetical protein
MTAKPLYLAALLAILTYLGVQLLLELRDILIMLFVAVVLAAALSRPTAALQRRGPCGEWNSSPTRLADPAKSIPPPGRACAWASVQTQPATWMQPRTTPMPLRRHLIMQPPPDSLATRILNLVLAPSARLRRSRRSRGRNSSIRIRSADVAGTAERPARPHALE